MGKNALPEIVNYLFPPKREPLPPSKERDRNWLSQASPELKQFQSDEKTGKWCISASPAKVDKVWSLIRGACISGDLLLAKCSTALNSGTKRFPNHIICIYNQEWSDSTEIARVRKVLEDLGFKKPLKYKRDLETINGVYGTDDEFYIDEEKTGIFRGEQPK